MFGSIEHIAAAGRPGMRPWTVGHAFGRPFAPATSPAHGGVVCPKALGDQEGTGIPPGSQAP